jgi:hypothetical protein
MTNVFLDGVGLEARRAAKNLNIDLVFSGPEENQDCHAGKLRGREGDKEQSAPDDSSYEIMFHFQISAVVPL